MAGMVEFYTILKAFCQCTEMPLAAHLSCVDGMRAFRVNPAFKKYHIRIDIAFRLL